MQQLTILQSLLAHGPLTFAELERATLFTYRVIESNIAQLRRDGLVLLLDRHVHASRRVPDLLEELS